MWCAAHYENTKIPKKRRYHYLKNSIQFFVCYLHWMMMLSLWSKITIMMLFVGWRASLLFFFSNFLSIGGCEFNHMNKELFLKSFFFLLLLYYYTVELIVFCLFCIVFYLQYIIFFFWSFVIIWNLKLVDWIRKK